MASETKVNEVSADYDAMKGDWDLVRALWGGTKAMREATTDYLPQEPAESDAAYEIRLARSVLFNAFKRTVRTLVGKPFRKPLVLGENTDAGLTEWTEDVDLSGNNLDVFAWNVFESALRDGITYILVDAPKTDGELTLADEREQGIRPYMVHVDARDVIGWRSDRRAGRDVVTQVRIAETITQDAGEFGEVVVNRIRVLEPGRFRVFEQTNAEQGKQSEWIVIEEGETPNMPVVPLVPVYTNRTGMLTATPPLRDLAYLNIEHWQSSSDQANILHAARVPILFGAGFTKEETTSVEIGASRMLSHTNADSKLSYVEHSGKAIAAGRESIEDNENRMRIMGLELLVRRPGNVTATARALDQAEMDSELAAMVRGLEDALDQALTLMGTWVNKPDASDGLQIYQDFGITLREASDVDTLLKARGQGEISQATFLGELKRRGLLMDDVDIETEVELTAAEGGLI